VLAALGHVYAVSGRKAEALKIIRDLQERSKKEFVPSYSIATIYHRTWHEESTSVPREVL